MPKTILTDPLRRPAPSPTPTRLLALLAVLTATASVVAAQPAAQPGDDRDPPDAETPRYRIKTELKTHFRSSDSVRFPVPFPFTPEMLPPGATQGFMETVDAGDHFEISTLSLYAEATWSERLSGRIKLDLIDRHDRNPTSEDREVDIDQAWIRFGRETPPARLPERRGAYVKIGKFGKFERQDDRNLESYGLTATAFNRLEDVGLELGVDLTRHLYVKGSLTQGNPLFFRDPNLLAGDNGTSPFDGSVINPIGELGTGLPVLYDADVDTIDFEHPEVGAAVGVRGEEASGFWGFDLLFWGYERELAEEASLGNTFYGGDLDLLLGPLNLTPLPVTGDDKREVGLNIWLYWGGLSFFGQYVDQDLAGLDRTGFEVELAWGFDLPLVWAVGGRQLFSRITPVVRFSELDPDFALHPNFPAPSVAWDWEKLDVGLRLAIYRGFDLTLEYQDNTFIRLGQEESNDEFVATLRLAFQRPWTGDPMAP